jgi:hypothetical protein
LLSKSAGPKVIIISGFRCICFTVNNYTGEKERDIYRDRDRERDRDRDRERDSSLNNALAWVRADVP